MNWKRLLDYTIYQTIYSDYDVRTYSNYNLDLTCMLLQIWVSIYEYGILHVILY